MVKNWGNFRHYLGQFRAVYKRRKFGLTDKEKWEREINYAGLCGLSLHSFIKLDPEILHFQFRSELEPVLNKFLVDDRGNYNRALRYSPLYDLVRQVRDRGEEWVLNRFDDTAYFSMFQELGEYAPAVDWATGQKLSNRRTSLQLYQKIEKFIRAHNSLQRYGYLGGEFGRSHIMVTEAPYEVYRYKTDLAWEPYEVWSGHHRASSLLALEKSEIEVALLKWTGLPD